TPCATFLPYTTLFRSVLAFVALPILVGVPAQVLRTGSAEQERAAASASVLTGVKVRPAFTDMPGLFRPLDFGQFADGRYWVCERSEEHTSELQSRENL